MSVPPIVTESSELYALIQTLSISDISTLPLTANIVPNPSYFLKIIALQYIAFIIFSKDINCDTYIDAYSPTECPITESGKIPTDFNNSKEVKLKVAKLNMFLKIILGEDQPSINRIQIYNGKKLPFQNSTFDLIFSQQVIEHLPPSNKIPFLLEERRVIKKDGIMYHQIPHRLVPYEAHTKTWFVHWLPKSFGAFYFKKFEENT